MIYWQKLAQQPMSTSDHGHSMKAEPKIAQMFWFKIGSLFQLKVLGIGAALSTHIQLVTVHP